MSTGASPYPGKPRILFVEDEDTLRTYLAEQLSDEYIVDTAGNGLEALKAVMRKKPDLIVTDIVMPEMDGVELLRTLRSEPSTEALPLLLISGRAGEAQRIEGFREGADGYLAKPYSVSELRAVVGAMLHAARLRAETGRRRAAKQALAERAALLESITDAFYALDRHLRFTYINHRALDYFRKGREELLGRRIDEAFPVIKGTEVEERLQRVLREQCSAGFETFSPVSQSWVELNIYPATQGLAVYFRDISDRKRAEQELQRAEESLRQSDRRKSEFLALLAHELRNPLAPIGNGVQILRLRAGADTTSDRTLDMMERQLKHLVRLVDDLLDVGRITSGKLQLRTQRVVMTDVLETAVESARNQIERHGHDLAVEIRARDLVVEADPDRLVQVFANLLVNGAKYTERGGLIRVTLERQDREAVVMVADNGIGMPPQSIGEVFEMFSQLGNRPTHAEGGLGIGLALVHRLVQMHGGTVSAGSEGVGKGSTFTVRLPLQVVADSVAPLELSAAATPPGLQLASAPP